jgi:hypothetical protein
MSMKTALNFGVVLVAALLFGILVSSRAVGQAAYGNVIGTVTDATGAAVPNAKITATDTAKGVSYTATTNASGYYTLNNLTPGDYKVVVEAQGFKGFQQEPVPVIVGTSSTLNASLQVGATTESVTVSGAPPLLETDRAAVSTDLSSGQIADMPIVNRNFTQLQLLLPGSAKMPWQHGQTENPQGGIQVNTNGQLFSGTNFMIDGMDNTDPVLGIVMINPPIDSVQEFRGTTSNFDAEFSQAGGSVIQVQTKSGTNDFHGSLFEFLQNDYFQARDQFTQKTGKLPPLRWNQFGGSIGGPIKKDKLFAFFDYQGTRQHNGGEVSIRVPTAAERTGDLSDLGVPIYDPTTGAADGSGRTQFSDSTRATPSNPLGLNIIPLNRITAQATNLLATNFVPLPNLTPTDPTANNYAIGGVQVFNTNQFDIRVDDYVTNNLRYFGRYSYGGYHLDTPGALGIAGGQQFNNLSFEGISNVRNQNGIGALTYNFGTSLLSDFRFGVTRYRVLVSSPDASQPLATQVGILGLNDPNRKDTWGLPDLNIGGGTSSSAGGFLIGYRCNCPLDEEETEYQGATNWTKLHKNHTFKWGADIRRRVNLRLPSDQHRAGVYDFSSNVTANGGVSGSGLGLASFLLGDASQFNRFAQISTNQKDLQWSMYYYLSDTWRITPKLTLNYGLRWDTWFADQSRHKGQGGRYDATDNLVRIPGVGGVSLSGGVKTDYNNFSPRVGIAYAVDPKTVVRTGYGRSYFQGTFGWTFNTLAADVYPSIVNQSIPTPTNPFFPAIDSWTPPPPPVFPVIPSNGLLPLPDKIGTSYIPANQPFPYVDSWNLTVERAVFSDATLGVGYVGNVGRKLNYGPNINAAFPSPTPVVSLDPQRPLFQKFGLTQGIGEKCDCSNSGYNALQIKFSKRFTRNYSIMSSYTWAKALNFGEFGPETDNYHPRIDHGPAVFDRASIFTLGHTVQLPFGRGQRWGSNAHRAVDVILGGWEWTGITTVESGLPFSPSINNSTLHSDMSTRPDRIGDPFAGVPHNRTQWFNAAAFAPPAPGVFGNAGRNSLRGPGLFTADWGLDKNFHFTERVNLQFRWEVFNALNRVNLAQPVNDVLSSSAGLIQDISSPMRNQQFGLHLTF